MTERDVAEAVRILRELAEAIDSGELSASTTTRASIVGALAALGESHEPSTVQIMDN